MIQFREVDFNSEASILSDIDALRRGHTSVGNWTLAMACWHLKLPLDSCLHMPKQLETTPDQRELKGRLDTLIDGGKMSHGMQIFPGTEPPADASETAIDGIVAGLKALQAYSESHVDFGHFGAVPTDRFRKFICKHTENHLAFFLPKTAD